MLLTPIWLNIKVDYVLLYILYASFFILFRYVVFFSDRMLSDRIHNFKFVQFETQKYKLLLVHHHGPLFFRRPSQSQ